MLTHNDIAQLENRNISQEKVENQIKRFEKGFEKTPLVAPAVIGEGILKLSAEQEVSYVATYEASEVTVSKFVPASGAASRMFKALFAFAEAYDGSEASYNAFEAEKGQPYDFFEGLQKFAFYEDLKVAYEKQHKMPLEEALSAKLYKEILLCFLNEPGLNYGGLPKGLLQFHLYTDTSKTPAQEHVTEGLKYALKAHEVNIHFTVSPEHQQKFEEHIQKVTSSYSEKINVSFSVQKPHTDTVAVTLANEPFKDEKGDILFRPAGHGALLENLNDIEADIIFIKNIDNVVPDRIKDETIRYKKILAGVLLDYQSKAFDLLRQNESGASVIEQAKTLLAEMGVKGQLSDDEVIAKLNRPIRVCGMVKNEGEPGGGPFWVAYGEVSLLQIVESAQIDMNNPEQVDILKKSTHFNPVDLVCGVKNYKGEKFDLMDFQDQDAGFISEKSYAGEKLKAMELPGLWNGSMAHWNTIFVEVPLITFNPVKTVMDLLKANHL